MWYRTLAFGTAAALIPFVLLLIVEAGLRLAGVNEEAQAPFRPIEGRTTHLAFNPAYTSRYFGSFAPAVAFNPFLTEKEPGSFRVVAMGGSSTAGFPYAFYYAFPAKLMERLQRHAMSQRIEVINLGMTAVNSYTLWDLKESIVKLEPDAVLIYAGHNEFYGAFGAGSSEYGFGTWIWPKRLLLELKGFVLFRLMERVILGQPEQESGSPDGRTMMARVVRDATITKDGPVFVAGLEQFEANLGAVLATFEEASIPVYVGTLASNLKDQPPLGDNPEAVAAFRQGTLKLASGDTSAAAALFSEARDLDEIRFRAPDTLNRMIRTLADTHNAEVVDVAGYLTDHSPEGIPGASLFDDHLHPNAFGYDLVAEAFFDAIKKHPDLSGIQLTESMSSLSRIDPIQRAEAELQMARLKGGYPFDKDVTPAAERARYLRFAESYVERGSYDSLAVVSVSQRELPQEVLRTGVRMARGRRDTLEAQQLSFALLNWQPFNEPLIEDAVSYASDNRRFDTETEALAFFGFSRTGHAFYLNTLAGVALRQRHYRDAQALLELAESRDPDDRVMLYNRARLFVIQGDTAAAQSYFDRYRSKR